MSQTPTSIHDTVREHYAGRIKNSGSCCGTKRSDDLTGSLYPLDLLTTVPSDVSETSYGCGDPITLAALTPGQVVLDLGSGAGLDCIFAAKKVGPAGRVIGVDMTPEMIERAQANAQKLGLANVDFRQGFLEDLPVESGTVDVIISNCVINLSPDKDRVFSEAFRVLKPGGKLAVSDIVTDGPLPDSIKKSLSAWAGCVAGAVEAQDYIGMMKNAGFDSIEVKPVFFDRETVDAALDEMGDEVRALNLSRDEVHRAVYSAKITAWKK